MSEQWRSCKSERDAFSYVFCEVNLCKHRRNLSNKFKRLH